VEYFLDQVASQLPQKVTRQVTEIHPGPRVAVCNFFCNFSIISGGQLRDPGHRKPDLGAKFDSHKITNMPWMAKSAMHVCWCLRCLAVLLGGPSAGLWGSYRWPNAAKKARHNCALLLCQCWSPFLCLVGGHGLPFGPLSPQTI